MAFTRISAEQGYRKTQLTKVKTSKSVPVLQQIIGQDRAQKAIAFAMHTQEQGYNVYACGPTGLGKRTTLLRYLKQLTVTEDSLADWCYVANFEDQRCPKLIKLPCGSGKPLKNAVDALMNKLMTALPLAFDNEVYFQRENQLKQHLNKKQENALQAISQAAEDKGIRLVITQQGEYQFAALNGEELHTDDSFAALESSQKQQIEQSIDQLEVELRSLIRQITQWEDAYQHRLKELHREIASGVMQASFNQLMTEYSEQEQVKNYLTRLYDDVIEHLYLFLGDEDGQQEHTSIAAKEYPRRYQINILVQHHGTELPVIVEDHPNYHQLFGFTETATYKGTVFTDFAMIRPGSLHQANGGILMMEANKVLEKPYVWEGLKRCLRSGMLAMTSLEKELTLTGAVTLDPEPMPLQVKIVLFGDLRTYQLLQQYDAEFTELFRVNADFTDRMPRTVSSEFQYAQLIASMINKQQLRHCDGGAVSRIIEYAARQVEDQQSLSLYAADIVHLLQEADFAAKQEKVKMIRLKHIEQALAAQQFRVNRYQQYLLQQITEGTYLLQTDGEEVGQVNGLSVMTTVDHAFGLPHRITATAASGNKGIIDIERDVELAGNIHSKGVLILSAFLAARLAQEHELPLTIHLTVEQSYGEIDGDSATMAEFVAILSAISHWPLKQSIAVTGSMNQFGQAQAVGGINEKIEGFFDVCQRLGRHNAQGVIIPRSNQQQLMLRTDVQTAISQQTFHVWVVDHVDDVVALLIPAQQGTFSAEEVYKQARQRVQRRFSRKKD